MKRFVIAVLCLAMVLGHTSSASARSSKKSKEDSNPEYIIKKCKTKACFKKHPSGEYSVRMGQKRKK